MIGVICHEAQRPFVREFYELFKTPWEFWRPGGEYDVVVMTAPGAEALNARLVVMSGADQFREDVDHVVRVPAAEAGDRVNHRGRRIPVHGPLAFLERAVTPLATVEGRPACVVVAEYQRGARRIVRMGYDLFEEVRWLLSEGQSPVDAAVPTLDLHIDILRGWIVNAGVPLVEIPPRPQGREFAVCLTHDVDFMNLRDHVTDRSVLGFIRRALLPSSLRNADSRIVWSRLWRNWKAIVLLPAVYLRLCRDTWFDIDRYDELERGLDPTYFFLPLKDHAGRPLPAAARLVGTAPPLRAARYRIEEHASVVADVEQSGGEVALHGIDAWHSAHGARRERTIIGSVSADEPAGVRMHWLYFSEGSPRHLEEAGFLYDSTLGFNEAVGFRSGTTQVFRFPDTTRLLELPLNIMDTALFYPRRMGLSEREAFASCIGLIDMMTAHGGVLTINWHTRSLSPDRNWDDFYARLLAALRSRGVWFTSARRAVEWFRGRREIQLEEISCAGGGRKVRVSRSATDGAFRGAYVVRVHRPGEGTMSAFTDKSLGDHDVTVAV